MVGNPCPDMLGVGEVVPMYWGTGITWWGITVLTCWEWEKWFPCTGGRDHVVGNPCPDMLGVGEVVPMYWGQGSRGGESLS